MRLTTRSRYGTRLLLDIALNQDKGWVNTTDIARRQNISQKYIEKLITGLRRGELIESKRGPFGGHKLAKSAMDITVGDVVRALEEKVALTQCAEGEPICGECSLAGECVTQFVWIEASNVLMQTLDSHRLGELIARKG
ncbi:transcriptional regulator, BadM/Rrf2 family [Desulfomicrobium apsheronum]|uniref:Transcriptional regulator, BadM/Rrf2 family n=1 Tax=Desulfomicrobium apsheronum TaxID=52560 RepID=A0A1I3QE22_9BACT|nr:Rrf2 family transcriptional regulator [Desulfomicrobium apsheronum]SFJ31611.1 transcriptional regulator, BadM/Rrf2 family [Desulfomicrobium apsheronum]